MFMQSKPHLIAFILAKLQTLRHGLSNTMPGPLNLQRPIAHGLSSRRRNSLQGRNQDFLSGALNDLREDEKSGWVRLVEEMTRIGYAPEGAKRRYSAHFISKLTDCDGENSETDTWLDFACNCGYLSDDDHERLTQCSRKIGGMLGSMLKNPSAFIINVGL
jgi:hypothetical protein